MSVPAGFDEAFHRARQMHAQGRLGEAEQAYRQLTGPGEHREAVLRALVELYMQAGRLQETIDTMIALTEVVPDRLYYFGRLAGLLEGIGQTDAAIGHYLRLLQRQPGIADAHYNLALLYKKRKSYPEALASYESAVRLGISRVEEVYSNMGVLYAELRQKDKAEEMYERALHADPGYIPALFNLAGLLEGAGARGRAIKHYERILVLEPRHWESLSRLAYARKLTRADMPLVDSLRQALEKANDDPLAREGLYFALGKALDDLEEYTDAFASYRAGNELGRSRNPPYDQRLAEQDFARLIELFSLEWLRRAATGSSARPIFICGMFRSGSTLVEQYLASHPSVTAGGELDYLPWLLEQRLAPYPARAASASAEELEEIGNEYLARIRYSFPGAERVTDKRPDNFLRLGLIKALFPAARIVHTRRNPVDNCLSIYFHQLGGNLSYATDLENIVHYYQQHVRLMKHWASCFADDIFYVDYDELVRFPEPAMRRLVNFLGLEWDGRCLDFRQTDNLVQTASVWQVREELYDSASGRWRNYAPFLDRVRAALETSATETDSSLI